jgi:hypothetical protein
MMKNNINGAVKRIKIILLGLFIVSALASPAPAHQPRIVGTQPIIILDSVDSRAFMTL